MRDVSLCCSPAISHMTQKHTSSLGLLCPGAGSALWSQAVCGNSVLACGHEFPRPSPRHCPTELAAWPSGKEQPGARAPLTD